MTLKHAVPWMRFVAHVRRISLAERVSCREALAAEQRQDLGGGFGDVGGRPVDRSDTSLFQEIVILGRDHAAADDDDVVRPRPAISKPGRLMLKF